MAPSQVARKHDFVAKVAGGCSSYDVIAPWPDLTGSIFFAKNCARFAPSGIPKPGGATHRRFFAIREKPQGGCTPPLYSVRARVKSSDHWCAFGTMSNFEKTQLEVRSLNATWSRDLWGHRVIVFLEMCQIVGWTAMANLASLRAAVFSLSTKNLTGGGLYLPVRRHVWRWTSETERDKSVFGVASMSRLSGFRVNETGDARANVQSPHLRLL